MAKKQPLTFFAAIEELYRAIAQERLEAQGVPTSVTPIFEMPGIGGKLGTAARTSTLAPALRISPIDARSVTMDDVLREVAARTTPDLFDNRLFYAGDHLHNGDFWTGAMVDKNTSEYDALIKMLKRVFVSRNVIKQLVDTHVDGACSKEPSWYFAPKDWTLQSYRRGLRAAQPIDLNAAFSGPANSNTNTSNGNTASGSTSNGNGQIVTGNAANGKQRPLMPMMPTTARTLRTSGGAFNNSTADQVNNALTLWWDQNGIHQQLRKVVEYGLLSERAYLRFFIPPDVINPETGMLYDPPQTLEEALSYIYVHACASDEATVVVNNRSMQEMGVYVQKLKGGTEYAEISTVFGRGEAAQTIVATMERNRQTKPIVPEQSQAMSMLLGGRLPIFELVFNQLITEQVRQQQKALNHVLTMAQHNVEIAGFLERIIVNGAFATKTEVDSTGQEYQVVAQYETGGGAISHINGYNIIDPQTQRVVGVTTPEVIFRNPSDPVYFEKTETLIYLAMLAEGRQVHTALADAKYVSGEARKQARADFHMSLRGTASTLNIAGRWLLETALYMALHLLDDSALKREVQNLRAVFSTRITPGPATVEEIRSAIELRTARGLSRNDMQEMAGIEDPDAVNARIDEEDAAGVPWPNDPTPLTLMQSAMAAKAQADAAKIAADAAAKNDTTSGNGSKVAGSISPDRQRQDRSNQLAGQSN